MAFLQKEMLETTSITAFGGVRPVVIDVAVGAAVHNAVSKLW